LEETMSDTPTPEPAPPVEPPHETLLERFEEAVGFPRHLAPAPAKPDVGHPWWITSDPTHPVNRDAAVVAQEAAQAVSDEARRVAAVTQNALNGAKAAVEAAEAAAAAAIKRAEAAEAKLAALVPPPEPVVDPSVLAPGETLVEAGRGWVQTSTGRRIVDLNGERAKAAGLVVGEHPAAVDSAAPVAPVVADPPAVPVEDPTVTRERTDGDPA
jgi:hypothetical protein